MSNTTGFPSTKDDYYTLEMLQEIWHPDWFQTLRNGQWHAGRGEPMTHISPHYQHYFPYACHSCKRGSINVDVTLSTCSGCRVLSYCSRKCQASDWKYHKSWCKAFQGLCKSGFMHRAVKYDSINDWRADVMTLIKAMLAKLGGFDNMSRHSSDIQIVGLQPRCRKCFQAGFKMDPSDSKETQKVTLCPCPRCMGVALCEPCLAEEENKTSVAAFHRDCPDAQYECEQYLLSISIQGMIVEQGNPLGMPSDTDCCDYWRPKDWREYFATKRTDFGDMPEPMFNLAPVVAFLSAAHSPMLTIQHVLGLPRNGNTDTDVDTLLSESDRTTKKRFVIHFCGATAGSEFLMPGRYVEMIRLNPHLTTLELHLVGPELNDLESEHDKMQQMVNMENIRPRCKIVIQTHAGLYHDIMDSRELTVPDVVMCCHSGIHDPGYTDMWQPTIEYLIANNYLVIFTGYTHDEVIQDAKLVQSWGGRIVIEPTPNPFRALWPSADPNRETSEFIYNHASFVVLQGSK